MKRLLPAAALLLLLAGFASWWFSPTQALKREVGELIDRARVPAAMSDLARSSRGRVIEPLLADPVEIDPAAAVRQAPSGAVPRQRLVALLSGAARYCRSISLEDLEFDRVEIDGDEARVEIRLDAIVEVGSRRPLDGIQVVTMRWTRADGDWLLAALAWEEQPRGR